MVLWDGFAGRQGGYFRPEDCNRHALGTSASAIQISAVVSGRFSISGNRPRRQGSRTNGPGSSSVKGRQPESAGRSAERFHAFLKRRASYAYLGERCAMRATIIGCFEGYANLPLCTPDATTPNGVALFDDH
jgi:hypothetical protein